MHSLLACATVVPLALIGINFLLKNKIKIKKINNKNKNYKQIVLVFIITLRLIVFGFLTTLLKYWTGYIKLIRPQELNN